MTPSPATPLPCPFCAIEPRWVNKNCLRCDSCGITISRRNNEITLAAWNHRPTQDARVEALEFMRALEAYDFNGTEKQRGLPNMGKWFRLVDAAKAYKAALAKLGVSLEGK